MQYGRDVMEGAAGSAHGGSVAAEKQAAPGLLWPVILPNCEERGEKSN